MNVSCLSFKAEESRIFKAGGWIECNRVNGNLALSRAIGDFNFKKNSLLPPEEQIVTGTYVYKYISIEDTLVQYKF